MAAPPAFFTGQVSVGSGVYYLQFPNNNLFGYYTFVANSIFYRYDLGYEAFIPGSTADVFLYDFASGHWWYTSNTLFPDLYDFTLNTWIYYFSNTANPGHYTTDPRYFANLTGLPACIGPAIARTWFSAREWIAMNGINIVDTYPGLMS